MNHSDFISRVRTMADRVIESADAMGAIGSILHYSDITESLIADDFAGDNATISPAQVFAFLDVLGRTIAGLSDDDKKAIYAIKH